MDIVSNVFEKLHEKTKEAETLARQYRGLIEFEKQIQAGTKDINIDVVISQWNGQRSVLGESRSGGRLTGDFGIKTLNETFQTLLLAKIGERKKEIKLYFKLLGEDMKIDD